MDMLENLLPIEDITNRAEKLSKELSLLSDVNPLKSDSAYFLRYTKMVIEKIDQFKAKLKEEK
jgi:hypothetical protein